MKFDYYWTTVSKVNPGAKFKLHPDRITDFIRDTYNQRMKQYECWHCVFGIQYFDGSEIVCVMRGE